MNRLIAALLALFVMTASTNADRIEDDVQSLMGANREKRDTARVLPITRSVLCDTKERVAAVLDSVGMVPLFQGEGATGPAGPVEVTYWFSVEKKVMVEVTVVGPSACMSNGVRNLKTNPSAAREVFNQFIGESVDLRR